MQSFDNNNISLIAGVTLFLSLFMAWISFGIDKSLISIPGICSDIRMISSEENPFDNDGPIVWTFGGYAAQYIGWVFAALGSYALYYNYKKELKKARLYYYLMPAYILLVILLNWSEISDFNNLVSDEPGWIELFEMLFGIHSDLAGSIFNFFGIGLYVFFISWYLAVSNLSELIKKEESEQ